MTASPTSHDLPLRMEEVLASAFYRDLMTPKLASGDPAFDFELPRLDTDDRPTGETVRLSSYAGKQPVALVFGSYT